MKFPLLFFSVLLLFLSARHGQAAVVLTYRGDNPNPFLLEPPYIGSSDFDINGDGIADFRFINSPFTSSIKGYGSNRVLGWSATPPGIGSTVLPVAQGDIIGADTTFPIGQWLYPGENTPDPVLSVGSSLAGLYERTAYIGVEFMAADGIHYGWISYMGFRSPDTDTRYPYPGGFVNVWAWESEPGKSITVVPEPSVAVLGLGLIAGVLLRRRRPG